jgi:simple sugar transport system permease protein
MNNDNKLIGFLARNRITGVFVILVAVVIFFTLYSPDNNFIRVANLKNLGVFGSEFGIVALGVGLLMIAGEFDLSVGSVLAFCSLVFTWTNELSIDPFIGLLITLAAGVMTGLINGVITVRGKIVSFVTTLGAMMFWRGLTLMLSRGEMQAVNLDAYPLFTHIFTGEWFGFFPAQAFWFLLLVVILTLVLHSQRFGNWIFSRPDPWPSIQIW